MSLRQKEAARQTGYANRTHGKSRTKEYESWRHMLSRCENPMDAAYYNYGARGIQVCPQWHSFEVFLFDMKTKPGPNYSLERIDNSLGYFPANCKWATRTEQNLNQRRTRMLIVDGKSVPLILVARKHGINYFTFYARISTGMSVEEAVRKGPGPGR